MNDKVILTDKDVNVLYQAVPNDLGPAIHKKLLTEPALNEFTVRVNHENGTASEYAFLQMAQGCRFEKTVGIPAELVRESCVGCVIKAYGPAGDKLADGIFVFGCDYEDASHIYAYQPFYLHPSQPQGTDEVQAYGDSGYDLYVSLQYLLMHHAECLVFEVQRKSATKHTTKKGRTKKKTITQKVRVYHLAHIDDEMISRIHRAAAPQRKCPAWGVRGHYRHCRSGKVVYVKPHVKGKSKELYKGREYAFVPKAASELATETHR